LLETGNNFVANLCPVNAGGTSPSSEGRTLSNSGLYTANPSTGLLGASNSNAADLVLLWNGTGYDQFYYSTGGFAGTGWRQVGSNPLSADKAGTAIPDGAYIVLRRGAPVMVSLNQGAF
jgi:hypothetical protein